MYLKITHVFYLVVQHFDGKRSINKFIIILMYTSQTKSKVKHEKVNCPIKPNTDLHNGDLKFEFSSSVILLVIIRCLQ